MSVSEKMSPSVQPVALDPPSEQARAIYQLAMVECHPTEEIAQQMQLPLASVQQGLDVMLAWIGAALPGVNGALTAQQQLATAKQITRDRLKYFAGLLIQPFRAACQPQEARTLRRGQEPKTVIRSARANPQFVKIAADIAIELAKFDQVLCL